MNTTPLSLTRQFALLIVTALIVTITAVLTVSLPSAAEAAAPQAKHSVAKNKASKQKAVKNKASHKKARATKSGRPTKPTKPTTSPTATPTAAPSPTATPTPTPTPAPTATDTASPTTSPVPTPAPSPSTGSAGPIGSNVAALNVIQDSPRGSIVGFLPQLIDGAPGVKEQDTYGFTLPAMANPGPLRRSEYLWATDGVTASFKEGDTVNFVAYIRGNLGAAANTLGNWHTLWQLHAETARGWVGPPLRLVAMNGHLVLSGGNGHPFHTATNSYQWERDLTTYQDNTTYKVEITAVLSSDPAKASVTAKINGATLLSNYHPVTPNGIPTGTIYADQPDVKSRTGLYRGTWSGAAPTYEQSVAIRMISAG